MKLIKNMIFKRIVIYLCCSVLIFSSVFMAYTMPVYAETTYADLLEDALYIAGAAAGIYFSGGTLTPALLVPFIERLAGTGFDVYDYVTQDEKAGTTTISADFVNLVLQAYKEYKEDNAEKFDGVMEPGADGYYHYDRLSGTAYLKAGTFQSAVYTDINTYYPCAVLVNSNKPQGGATLLNAPLIFYDKTDDLFYTTINLKYDMPDEYKNDFSDFGQILVTSLFLNKSKCSYDNSGHTGIEDSYPTSRIYMSAGWYEQNAYCEVSSSSIPVYHSLSALKQGLRTGDFSAAYNYGKPASSGESSSYTGEYNGGDITVLTEKLNGISDKLKEIDDTGKSIDEKLKELLDWLLKNGGTGGGADLTATNNWLEKIYLKVCQIFDEMHKQLTRIADDFESFFIFEDAPGINAKYISSLLERMLAQLRGISGDISDIKGQLENISEQEFNERSDSFLGEIMDAFSEIAEVAKTKFPFSIPNDLRIFLSKIAPAQPEAEAALYLDDMSDMPVNALSGITLYSEHCGGGTSDGETNPPGGGGSSRPGSGFIDVEHGGGGSSRDPVEMREAPVFRLPIVIERYGIEEYIIIDMSPFDPLSRFSRSFFIIIFIVCLFNLTFKVIGMWGDLVG